ncbi:MAG: TlpA disulfide reductase family protein [Daejeonella sp.]|uniref:TlpA family protein disulfide reductase n=1 Tax=Daejeonella sp. TaxID=2805397 RepID=UPI002735F0AD|nr:TlpA disulfide reductase family protein [Daejeonella sp.]MDP3468965.1 TlpA disulfide reductase family protein [Daejeonella sp.]
MELLKSVKSNISNILFVLLAGIMFFSADARTLLIQGLMKTGLYNADAPSSGLEISKTIPADLTFRSEDGELLTLSDNKGEVYFINFWATWCPPCRAEMPSINSLYSKIKNKDKVNFIMVDVDNKIASSVKYMKKHAYQLKVYSSESAIPENIFNGTLPTTVIIGPKGNIVFQHSGMADYDNAEMLNFLNELSR